MISGLIVSICFLVATALLGKLSRIILLDNVFKKNAFQQTLASEFITTFELCASVFEFGVIMERYGFLTYTLVTIAIFNYWGTAWRNATAAPHPHIINLVTNKTNLQSALLTILAQISSAAIVFNFYVKPIWSLGYQETHVARLAHTDCNTHLQVSPLHGFVVEAAATYSFMTALSVFAPRQYAFLTLPLSLVTVVYTAMHLTGGYFSPILASTIQFGCKGISPLDHLLVYWVGPLIGASLHLLSCNIIGSGKAVKVD